MTTRIELDGPRHWPPILVTDEITPEIRLGEYRGLAMTAGTAYRCSRLTKAGVITSAWKDRKDAMDNLLESESSNDQP